MGRQFGKLPSAMTPQYMALTHTELRLMVLLIAHSDGRDGTVKGVMVDALAKELDVVPRTVSLTIPRLVEKRVIEVDYSRGRGRTHTYRIVREPPEKRATQDCAFSEPENAQSATENAQSEPENAQTEPVKCATQDCAPSEYSSEISIRTIIREGEEEDSDLIDCEDSCEELEADRKHDLGVSLRRYGIDNPDYLIREFEESGMHVEPPMIETILRGLGASAGPGCKVQTLREKLPELIRQQKRAEAARREQEARAELVRSSCVDCGEAPCEKRKVRGGWACPDCFYKRQSAYEDERRRAEACPGCGVSDVEKTVLPTGAYVCRTCAEREEASLQRRRMTLDVLKNQERQVAAIQRSWVRHCLAWAKSTTDDEWLMYLGFRPARTNALGRPTSVKGLATQRRLALGCRNYPDDAMKAYSRAHMTVTTDSPGEDKPADIESSDGVSGTKRVQGDDDRSPGASTIDGTEQREIRECAPTISVRDTLKD